MVIGDLVGLDNGVWLLFEGMSTGTLVKHLDKLFKYGGDSQITGAPLSEIRLLADSRNTVIHGTWSPTPLWDEAAEMITCPWGRIDDDGEYWYCVRSRFGQYGEKQYRLSVPEVNLLATKIKAASESLLRAIQASS